MDPIRLYKRFPHDSPGLACGSLRPGYHGHCTHRQWHLGLETGKGWGLISEKHEKHLDLRWFEMISSPNIGESFWFIRKYRQELSIWSADITKYQQHMQISSASVSKNGGLMANMSEAFWTGQTGTCEACTNDGVNAAECADSTEMGCFAPQRTMELQKLPEYFPTTTASGDHLLSDANDLRNWNFHSYGSYGWQRVVVTPLRPFFKHFHPDIILYTLYYSLVGRNDCTCLDILFTFEVDMWTPKGSWG